MKPGSIIGLAALVQALTEVRRLASQGQWQESAVLPLIGSLFAFDADTAESVYGGVGGLRPGLKRMVALLSGRDEDVELLRMLQAVLRIERRLRNRSALASAISGGLVAAERAASTLGPLHDGVIERLALVYTDHLSGLKPRVMVSGEVTLLSQPRVVCRIRALLLAAVRAAVLWRQSGGSRLGLLLRNKSIRARAELLLTEAAAGTTQDR